MSKPSAVVAPLFLFCNVACSHAAIKPSTLLPGHYVQHVVSGGDDRSFILDVPKAADAGTPIPVVIVLHGWTANAAEAEQYTMMEAEGDTQGFATVFPDGVGGKGSQGWNAGFLNLSGGSQDDVKLLSDILDAVEKELSVDKSREYVCGHSNGAFLAYYAGARLSTRLAAVAGVAGTIGVGNKTIPTPTAAIPVLLIHGRADKMVRFDEKSQALLHGVGAEESAEWWAKQDGCNPVATDTESADGNVETELFSGGKDGADVELIAIANGGHGWPGGYGRDTSGQVVLETGTGVNAADLIWSFFKAHPKQPN